MSRLVVPSAIALLVLATYFAYSPALHGGFIWDDESLLTQNELVKAPDGLNRIWFSTEPIDYWPLTNSSFWLEWRLWGMQGEGYHLTNLLLHGAAALLVWVILRKLSVPGAYLAALLFAVHPVNVESVAWIAQRKNTLSMLLVLVATWCYLKSEKKKERGPEEKTWNWQSVGWYCASLLGFLLAMLSKGSVAILPLALLLIAWWQRGRITRSDLLRIAPFVAIAVPLTLVNIWFQHHSNTEAIREASIPERWADAGVVVWFYLSKAFLPIDLSFVYPQPKVDPGSLTAWLPLATAVCASSVLIWKRNTLWGRVLLFAWGFYCVALLPVMGFTDVYFMKYSLVADHYQYIAIVAVATLVAATWSVWQKHAQGLVRAAAVLIAVAVVAVLIWQSHQQSRLYENAITLYNDTLHKNPNCWMAHYNLANAYLRDSKPESAIEQFEETLRISPDFAEAHYNLNNALQQVGRSGEAIAHLKRSLELKPNFPIGHFDLGTLYLKSGKLPGAIEEFRIAIEQDPSYAEAYFNLALALSESGRLDEGVDVYQSFLLLRPDSPEGHLNLGNLFAQTNRFEEAIEQYQKATELKSDLSMAWANMAYVDAKLNRRDEAILAARKALEIAQSHGQTDLVHQLERWLQSY